MKKHIVILALIISSISLVGCTTAKAEKGPVTLEDIQDITPTEAAISTAPSNDKATTDQTENADNITAEADINTDSASTDTEYSSEDTFTRSVEIEGTSENITCKTYYSSLGYQMDYDVDRFTVSSENELDTFLTENPDPDLYPYIFINVSKTNAKGKIKAKDNDYCYVTKNDNGTLYYGIETVNDPYNTMDNGEGKKSSSNTEELFNFGSTHTMIGNTDVPGYIFYYGKEWNSRIQTIYFIEKDDYIYIIETQYYTEATEGYGTRINDLLKSFQFN